MPSGPDPHTRVTAAFWRWLVRVLAPCWKAIAPAVLGAVGSLANALADGTFNGTSVKIAAGGILTALAVYLIPNRTKASAGRPQ